MCCCGLIQGVALETVGRVWERGGYQREEWRRVWTVGVAGPSRCWVVSDASPQTPCDSLRRPIGGGRVWYRARGEVGGAYVAGWGIGRAGAGWDARHLIRQTLQFGGLATLDLRFRLLYHLLRALLRTTLQVLVTCELAVLAHKARRLLL